MPSPLPSNSHQHQSCMADPGENNRAVVVVIIVIVIIIIIIIKQPMLEKE